MSKAEVYPYSSKWISKNHISFSELKDYYLCPTYHYIKWILERGGFKGNQYTLTGGAVHSTNEFLLTEEYEKRKMNLEFFFDEEEIIKFYQSKFKEEVETFKEKNPEEYRDLDKKSTIKIFEQCKGLFKNILKEMKNKFGNYKVIKAEHELYQPIEGYNYNFKGFIDLVIQLEDGKYVIIDWKTTSSYWDLQKRTSKETTYQLTYYKHYYAKEFGIDPKDISTYFVLLKRAVKQDKNIEFIEVPVGPRKIQNALEYLDKAVANILNKKIEQNHRYCSQCECYNKLCNGRSIINVK